MAGRSLFVALTFYFVYNEKLNNKHIFGILILVVSIIVISIGTHLKEN